MSPASFWGSKVRQFRAHRRARVEATERAALAGWLTPAQLALFDAMHVADRRHGLDVVATLRAEGSSTTELLLAGLLHDAGKGDTGLWPRVAYSLGQDTDPGSGALPAVLPGFGGSLERLQDHAEASAATRGGRRLLGADRRADPPPGRATGRRRRRAAAAGRRGELMTLEAAVRRRDRARPSSFGEGRRPDATVTHVQVAEFDGAARPAARADRGSPARRVTVPLGALADAYLDALASLEDDRLGNVSSFVAVASQLILIKSRAMLPRRVELPAGLLPEDEPDPEAELRARLLLYRAHRDAGARLHDEARLADRAVPARAFGGRRGGACRRASRRRAASRPAAPRRARSTASPASPRRRSRRRRSSPATITLTERAAIIREAIRAPARARSSSRSSCAASATGSSSRSRSLRCSS